VIVRLIVSGWDVGGAAAWIEVGATPGADSTARDGLSVLTSPAGFADEFSHPANNPETAASRKPAWRNRIGAPFSLRKPVGNS
jgi:hypothetical protein